MKKTKRGQSPLTQRPTLSRNYNPVWMNRKNTAFWHFLGLVIGSRKIGTGRGCSLWEQPIPAPRIDPPLIVLQNGLVFEYSMAQKESGHSARPPSLKYRRKLKYRRCLKYRCRLKCRRLLKYRLPLKFRRQLKYRCRLKYRRPQSLLLFWPGKSPQWLVPRWYSPMKVLSPPHLDAE
jgi:hypothetical protein